MTFFAGDQSAPTRFGLDVAGAGTDRDLFLKFWAGVVVVAYAENVIMRERTMLRNINSGS